MITKIEESGQASYGLASFICDDENDIIELEEIAESVPAGSTALIIDSGRVLVRRHVKNSNGKYWQEFSTDEKDSDSNNDSWPADLPKPSLGGYGYTEQGEQVLFDGDLLINHQSSAPTGAVFGSINIDSLEAGETYKIVWNGVDYTCECMTFNLGGGDEGVYLGNLSIVGLPISTDYPFIFVYQGEDGYGVATSTSGTYSIKLSKSGETVHTIDEKYLPEADTDPVLESAKATGGIGYTDEDDTVHKIDEKYLPENLATKSDVEATQEVLYDVFSSVATFTFDKQTSGRDTFAFNAFDYYKISDFNPAPEDVISFKGTRESGDEFFVITAGNNCVEYGLFIVVASAGLCSIPVSETTTFSFTAPSAGLYARYGVDNPVITAGTAEFTLKFSGIFLKSSTTGSTKKFRITVDDSGTISATEVV